MIEKQPNSLNNTFSLEKENSLDIDDARYLTSLFFQIKKRTEQHQIFLTQYSLNQELCYLGAESIGISTPELYLLNLKSFVSHLIPDIISVSKECSIPIAEFANAHVTVHYDILQAPVFPDMKTCTISMVVAFDGIQNIFDKPSNLNHVTFVIYSKHRNLGFLRGLTMAKSLLRQLCILEGNSIH
jgi:hypothetical protein